MFAFICGVQLALDSLDRLVDTLEERGTLTVVEAARALFATTSIPDGLARSLLEVALPLIERQGITLVGVSISNLDDDLGQLRLPLDGAWSDSLDAAMDEVRVRFGSDSITRAVLLGRRQGFAIPLLPD